MDTNLTSKTRLPALTSFVDQILTEAYPDGLATELHEQMKVDLLERVDEFLTRKILDALPSDKLEEYSDLLDREGGDEASQKFISENIANLDELIQSALAEFRDLYLKK